MIVHLFRYGKISLKGSKCNFVGGFVNFMKIGAGCAVRTGINEINLWVWCESMCTMSVFFIVGKARLWAVKTD